MVFVVSKLPLLSCSVVKETAMFFTAGNVVSAFGECLLLFLVSKKGQHYKAMHLNPNLVIFRATVKCFAMWKNKLKERDNTKTKHN